MDILYSINLATAIGDHQRVLHEGTVLLSGRQLDCPQEAKVLWCMWRAHMALGEANPLNKMAKTGVSSEQHRQLRDSLTLFSSFTLRRQKDSGFDADEFAAKADALPKDSLQCRYVAAVVLFGCGCTERAFELVRGEAGDLDCQLLVVSMLMALHRPDAATVRLEELKQRFGEDARLQVAEAGGVKVVSKDERAVKDALYTCQELAEVNGQTGRLLFLQAVCLERLGRFEEAEGVVQSALKLSPNDAAVVANALFLGSRLDMSILGELKRRLFELQPTHPLVVSLQQSSAVFCDEEF